MGEFELIAKYFTGRNAGRGDVVLGVGDDAAVLRVPADRELVVACDTIVAGVHFPPNTPPEAIGHRVLAVNLSDLAAMGASAAWFTLALTLPRADEAWLHAFSGGLLDLAEEFRVALVGGDTTSGPLSATVQVMGFSAPGTAIRRSGARPGDVVFVSGAVGDAAAGLALLQGRLRADAVRDTLIERFLYPQPRLALGQALIGVASAAIDVSDGLLADLGKVLSASGVGARVDMAALPVSPALERIADRPAALRFAAAGGDDYELCFTVPLARAQAIAGLQEQLGLKLTRIGTVETERGLRDGSGGAIDPGAEGFDHFRG